jgi:hypothetical protein
MIGKFVSCFVVSALGATLALTSPALARGGGGMGGGGMHFGGMGGGMHFGGGGFAGAHFAHPGFSPRFSRFASRNHRFFGHDRFNRFAFLGGPFLYDAYYYDGYYDGCWRRIWTSYGPQVVNVCGYY